jgi:hypothetical protein
VEKNTEEKNTLKKTLISWRQFLKFKIQENLGMQIFVFGYGKFQKQYLKFGEWRFNKLKKGPVFILREGNAQD